MNVPPYGKTSFPYYSKFRSLVVAVSVYPIQFQHISRVGPDVEVNSAGTDEVALPFGPDVPIYRYFCNVIYTEVPIYRYSEGC